MELLSFVLFFAFFIVSWNIYYSLKNKEEETQSSTGKAKGS